MRAVEIRHDDAIFASQGAIVNVVANRPHRPHTNTWLGLVHAAHRSKGGVIISGGTVGFVSRNNNLSVNYENVRPIVILFKRLEKKPLIANIVLCAKSGNYLIRIFFMADFATTSPILI